jgi:hypothetical protein
MYPNDGQLDFSQTGQMGQMGQQGYYDPAAIYNANNQYLMNSGQNAISEATKTALNNFQQQMAMTLQGTMNAGMALYNTSQNVADRARERVYQDALLTNTGGYALERSRFRDIMWATGIAGSEFGREWRIGGRRPEFLTAQEQSAQMHRSAHHRRGELMDAVISGGATIGGDLLGLGMGSMGLSGAAGFVAPIFAGMAVSELARSAVQPWLDQRKATREMAEFTEVADMNHGVGQRRIRAAESRQLALSFLEHDVHKSKYIPFVGGMLTERLGVETKEFKTFKEMTQMNMFRDTDLKDVEEIKTQVKRTVEVMDKYASIMHTTRDAILKIKGKLQGMGITGGQQDATLESMANFTLSTGYSAEVAESTNDSFIQMGRQMGVYSRRNGGLQGRLGMHYTAAQKALQDAGLIDWMDDPGTLAQHNFIENTRRTTSGSGKVLRHGGGNPLKARDHYAGLGGGSDAGSVAMGMQIERMDNSFDVNEEAAKNIRLRLEKYVKMMGSTKKAVAALLNEAKTPTELEFMKQTLSGLGGLGPILAHFSSFRGKAGRIFYEDDGGSGFKLNDILSYAGNANGASLSGYTGNRQLVEEQEVKDTLDKLEVAPLLSEESNSGLFDAANEAVYDKTDEGIWKHMKGNIKFWKKRGELAGAFQGAYQKFSTNSFKEADRNALIDMILKSKTLKEHLDPNEAKAREQANQIIDSYLYGKEQYHGGLGNYIKQLKSGDKTEMGFIRGYSESEVLGRRGYYTTTMNEIRKSGGEGLVGVSKETKGLSEGLNKLAQTPEGKKLLSQMAVEIQKSVGNKAWGSETGNYVLNAFEKYGLGKNEQFRSWINSEGSRNGLDILEGLFRDAHKGVNQGEYGEVKQLQSILTNYGTALKNSDAVRAFGALGVKNKESYVRMLGNFGQNIRAISAHEFNWEDGDKVKELMNQFSGVMGFKESESKSMVSWIHSIQGQKGKSDVLNQFLSEFTNGTFSIADDKTRKEIEERKEKITLGPENEVIAKFSQVLNKLADALNAK